MVASAPPRSLRQAEPGAATLATLDAFEGLGIAVFPNGLRKKGTYVKGWPEMTATEALKRTRAEAQARPINLAGRTGGGIGAIDLDAKNGIDPDAMLVFLRARIESAIIAIVRTARGYHVWLAVLASVGNGYCSALGGEVFSEPHLVMLPPSVHPSGAPYEWVLAPRTPANRADLRSLGLVPDDPDLGAGDPRRREPAAQEVQVEFETLMGEAGIARSRRVQALFHCPWHDDRAPSLSVNWETALFHCFGEDCKVGGGRAALRRLLGKDTPTYRQEGAPIVGNLGCVEEEVERLVAALEALGQADKARKLRTCKATFAVGQCTGCGKLPVFPLSCGVPLCPRCSSGRLAADWKEHEGSIPESSTFLRLTPRDFWGTNRQSLRKVRNRFREWRERCHLAAGLYGVCLDWRRGTTMVLLAIPSELPVPDSSRAFEVEVVARDQSPDDYLRWLQQEYAEEAGGWESDADLVLLLEQTRRRRRFQGFGEAYAAAKAAPPPANERELEEELLPLRKVSGGSHSTASKKEVRLCPDCGCRVQMLGFTVSASEVGPRDGFQQWLAPPGWQRRAA
jgi:hypothetical protein